MAEKHVILLNVSGKRTIEAEYRLEELDFFKLDILNPRFNHVVFNSEEDEEKRIWEDKDTTILYDSILASKGLSEPIIARQDGTVIEGNRRIVCLRKIREKYGNNPEVFPSSGFKRIPTYIFPKDVDPIEESIYLARLHVSGKKEWDAFNQAKYIHTLKEKYALSFEEIARHIGMSKGKVFQKYWAFVEAKKFLEKYKDESTNKYSFFEEAYKKKNIKEFIEGTKNRLEFYEWIVKKKLKGAKDVRQLAEVMGNNSLFSLFKRSGISIAYHKYQSLGKAKEDTLKKLLSELITVLKNIPRSQIKEISKDKEKMDKLNESKKEIESLIRESKRS